MATRTELRFSSPTDIWPIVDQWAVENKYKLKGSAGAERVYQKGTGLGVAPMMLKVRSENQETSMEAWVAANLLARIFSLFILPAEMGIESGGFRAVLPRSIARTAVNKLLAQLGQQPIP